MSTPNGIGSSSSKTNPNGNNEDLASAVKTKKVRDRELERKREKGEISCAECKRLKLKCSKKIPCSSCVRRGCHTICPNGSLSSGHGTRFVLANTDKLHSKLLDMSKRIRQLEDALHIAHTSISPNSYPHPLLTDEMLSIKTGVDLPENEEATDEVPELAVQLGTLAISHGGRSLFVGNVGSEALLLDRCGRATNVNVPDKSLTEALSSLPPEFKHLAEGFPFAHTSWSRNEMRALLKRHLPTYERATSLIEAYLENLAWFCRPVRREQIMEELLPALYKQEWVDVEEDGPESEESPEMHQLALSLAVFSCGAVVDLTLPPYNPEAIIYNYLARAALSLKSVFEGTSFETIQTIVSLSKFEFFVSRKTSLESAWKLMSFGLVLASSIGLHRDPARWKLDEKTIERRRHLFWELFPIDKWKSLGSGRPCLFHLDEIDCEPPTETEEYEDGFVKKEFRSWKHRFAKEILAPTSEYLGKVRPVKYSDILEFDRKIREFPDYPCPDFEDRSAAAAQITPRRIMWKRYKEILLLFLHRNFFAKAMIDQPVNPLRSPFAPSFLAAYSTSISYLKSSRSAYTHSPHLLDRQWTFWAHALVAAVMIGSVACRTAPSLASLTAAAREELIVSVKMFDQVKSHPVVAAGLPVVIRLRNKALILKQQQDLGYPRSIDLKIEDDEAYDELVILKGTSRTVDQSTSGKTCGSSKDASPEPCGSSSNKSWASPAATAGPETPASFSSPAVDSAQVRVNSPSMFAVEPASVNGASQIESSPWTHNIQSQDQAEVQLEQKPLDNWDIWVAMKLNGLAEEALADGPGTSPSNGMSGPWSSDSPGAPLPAKAPVPIDVPVGDPGSQQQSQQTYTQMQPMNPDAWSELGLRAVLESLNYDSMSTPGSFNSGASFAGTGQGQGSSQSNFNTNANTNGIDFTNLALNGDLTSTYGFINFSSNLNSSTQNQNPGLVSGQSDSGMNGPDEMSMDAGDASLMEAWRTMSDFPDFMGMDTGGFM